MALPRLRTSPATRFSVSSSPAVGRLSHAHLYMTYNFILVHIGLAPEIPEDLYHLIKKAVSVRKHLERNRKDKDSKYRLILIESRIHRLARYYKTAKKLPAVWKYE